MKVCVRRLRTLLGHPNTVFRDPCGTCSTSVVVRKQGTIGHLLRNSYGCRDLASGMVFLRYPNPLVCCSTARMLQMSGPTGHITTGNRAMATLNSCTGPGREPERAVATGSLSTHACCQHVLQRTVATGSTHAGNMYCKWKQWMQPC